MIDPETDVEDLKEKTLFVVDRHNDVGFTTFEYVRTRRFGTPHVKDYRVEFVTGSHSKTQVCILIEKTSGGWIVFCCGILCFLHIANYTLHKFGHSIVEINV